MSLCDNPNMCEVNINLYTKLPATKDLVSSACLLGTNWIIFVVVTMKSVNERAVKC